jgi:hypothetical protein
VGADFVVLDWPGHPDWPMSAKFAIPTVLAHYERVCYVDADVILPPGCVDLFAACPEGAFGAVDDATWPSLHNRGGPMDEYRAFLTEHGISFPDYLPYLNTGVFVAERHHAPWLEPPRHPLPCRHLSEQHSVNAALLASGAWVHVLPKGCNWQHWHDRGLKAAPPGAVLHCSGMRHEDRVRLMKQLAGPLLTAGGRLTPLLVTTLGRSGSSWLMRLLGQHPQIVTYRPGEREPRALTYWADVCFALSGPRRAFTPLLGEQRSPGWWAGGEGVPEDPSVPEEALARHLTLEVPAALSAFCRGRVDALAAVLAGLEGKGGTGRYLAEKFVPGQAPVRDLLRAWYPALREVVLVRDPRDLFCSAAAYNARRGLVTFGRDLVATDALHLAWLADRVAEMAEAAGRDGAHILRYEDLALRPEEALAGLLGFLGLEGDPQALLAAAALDDPAHAAHRTSPTAAESVGRWRRDLPGDLALAYSPGDTLARLGYAGG